MSQTKFMRYTKDSGEISTREVIVVSKPRENYLMYDVTKLTDTEKNALLSCMKEISDYTDDIYTDLTDYTGTKQASLWRSFKPEGVEWITRNEIQITK